MQCFKFLNLSAALETQQRVKMSKLSFRARQLDSNKALPVYRAEELPDLTEFSTINRAVPQMPTGMEKEEETEHHLQRAISAQQVYGDTQQLVIPTPETEEIKERVVETLYQDPFKQPKQYIHVQAFNFDEEVPEYDMDTEDEEWLRNFNKKKELLTPLRFEQLLDQLERNSGNQPVTANEAKSLLKDLSPEILKPLYDYWLNKRKKMKDLVISLIPQLKGEKRDGTSASDPYVAFRRRTEKMQTRKNRKNDEASYEKMLKLRRDLNRACTILDMVKRRESSKKELLKLTVDVFEKRYAAGDYAGQILQQCMDMIRYQPPATNLTVPTSAGYGENVTPGAMTAGEREQELWRRGLHERQRVGKNDVINELGIKRPKLHQHAKVSQPGDQLVFSDEEELIHVSPPPVDIPSEPEDDEDDPDGRFAFKRKRGVKYMAPRFDCPQPLPWIDPAEGGLGDKRFRFTCTSISSPQRVIGFARRRIGRGGRIYMDRGYSPLSEDLDELDSRLNSSTSSFSLPNGLFPYDHLTGWKKPLLPHFRPKSPPSQVTLSSHSSSSVSSTDSPSASKQTGEPRPRLHRSFSTQPRSKFSLNPTPTNGVVGLNFTHPNLGRNALTNGPLSNQGGYTTGALTSKNTAYSTAPMNSVSALNFPVNSGHTISNSSMRGNAPFSPSALSSSSSATSTLRAGSVENSGAEQMELDVVNRTDGILSTMDGLGSSLSSVPSAS